MVQEIIQFLRYLARKRKLSSSLRIRIKFRKRCKKKKLHKGWPDKYGHVFLVPCPVYTCSVAYTEKVAFYNVPEKHGNV